MVRHTEIIIFSGHFNSEVWKIGSKLRKWARNSNKIEVQGYFLFLGSTPFEEAVEDI